MAKKVNDLFPAKRHSFCTKVLFYLKCLEEISQNGGGEAVEVVRKGDSEKLLSLLHLKNPVQSHSSFIVAKKWRNGWSKMCVREICMETQF